MDGLVYRERLKGYQTPFQLVAWKRLGHPISYSTMQERVHTIRSIVLLFVVVEQGERALIMMGRKMSWLVCLVWILSWILSWLEAGGRIVLPFLLSPRGQSIQDSQPIRYSYLFNLSQGMASLDTPWRMHHFCHTKIKMIGEQSGRCSVDITQEARSTTTRMQALLVYSLDNIQQRLPTIEKMFNRLKERIILISRHQVLGYKKKQSSQIKWTDFVFKFEYTSIVLH